MGRFYRPVIYGEYNMNKRINLEAGWVYAIPLPGGEYGYFLCVANFLSLGIIFNCVSIDGLIRGCFADRCRWLRPASIWGLSSRCVKLEKVDFDVTKVPVMVARDEFKTKGGISVTYYLIGPCVDRNKRKVAPEDAVKFIEYLDITGGEVGFFEFVSSNRECFTIIKGAGEIPPHPVEDDSSREVELEVQIDTGVCPVVVDALIGEVEEALEDAELGAFEMVDGSDGEIIVRLAKDDYKRAAAAIRRILRRNLTAEQIVAGVEFTLGQKRTDLLTEGHRCPKQKSKAEEDRPLDREKNRRNRRGQTS
jgi:hypothetical protein